MSLINAEVLNLSQSILTSISELTASSLCIDIEKESFITIGCYLYRASPAIMELQMGETTQTDTTVEILQSIARKIDFANDLITKCKENTKPISDGEVKILVSELEGVIKDVGQDLSLIPLTAFEQQKFAAIAVRSLSQEMKNIQFDTSGSQLQHSSEIESLQNQTGRVHKLLDEYDTTEVPKTESDLYSTDIQVSMEDLQVSYGQIFVNSTSSSEIHPMKPRSSNKFIEPMYDAFYCPKNIMDDDPVKVGSGVSSNKFIEPLYDAFFCPLTKNIMDDPVTVGSGVTYERQAIEKWLTRFEDPKQIVCPTTGQKLFSKDLSTNIALKKTIEEWKERNEVGRIKAAAAALSSASSSKVVLEALKDLQSVCKEKEWNKAQIYSMGMLPLIGRFLGFKDRSVRCGVLDLLRDLADHGDNGKEMVGNAIDISAVIKMLSSSHHPTRDGSLLLLLELSKSQSLSKTIGSVKGAILILVTNKYSSIDSVATETASEILKNLESHPNNIKHMAENGYVEPLLNHLNEGNEEIQQKMATYLGGIFLDSESQIFVAERASSKLLDMVRSGNHLTKNAAFKALAKISSSHPNSKILIQSGIMQIMVEEIFSHNEAVNSKAEAASILANVIESGVDTENVKVTSHGHMLNSDYIIYSIVHMITHSTPTEININLIKILMNMTVSKKSRSKIVSILKESEESYTLIDLINSPDEQLAVAAIKFLTSLCSNMGHTIAERLCKTKGLPENLIRIPTATDVITQKMVDSIKFLATIPHQNLTLNVAILNKGLVPEVLQKISQVQGSVARFSDAYLEGLVGVLVRFTTTLYDPQILLLARTHSFTTVLTELLMKKSSDEVQRLSAQGLENLSAQSVNLSKPAEIKNPKLNKLISLPKSLSFRSSRKTKLPLLACPVHRGACSSQNTFCLVEAKAVERLLSCLEHENAAVVEAAMSALDTLLDDRVDVGRSLSLLSGVNAVQHVLKVVKEHKAERLWQKSFSMIEKFLTIGGDRTVVSEIRQDRVLTAALVSAFHRGEGTTKQMAERILRKLNSMGDPSSSTYTTTFTTYTTF